MDTAVAAKVKKAKAVDDNAAASFRAMALTLCEGADGVTRDRVLVKLYEAFLRGMADEGYDYRHRGVEAARAILGLPEEDD